MSIPSTRAVADLVAAAIGDDTHEQVAARGGPSSPTLTKILSANGDPISRASARKLETAFGWPAGTVASVARGDRVPDVVAGRRLKEMREAQGMSRSDLSDALGVGPKTLAEWEQGQYIPDAVIERMRAVLTAIPSTELLAELQRRAGG